jgi:hypothetical protein
VSASEENAIAPTSDAARTNLESEGDCMRFFQRKEPGPDRRGRAGARTVRGLQRVDDAR